MSAFISVAETSARLICSKAHVTRLLREGKLRGRKNGRVWEVDVSSLPHSHEGEVMQSAPVEKAPETAPEPQENTVEEFVTNTLAADPEGTAEVPEEFETQEENMLIPSQGEALAVPPVHAAFSQALANRKHVVHSIHAAPLYVAHPFMDLIHKFTALVTALALVFGAYTLIESTTGIAVLSPYRASMMAMVGEIDLSNKQTTFTDLETFALSWYETVNISGARVVDPLAEVLSEILYQ